MKIVSDHKGNTYPSITDMCKAYNITPGIFNGRRRIGWSVEAALTTPVGEVGRKGTAVTDHKGNGYDSVTAMCNAYNLPLGVYFNRILRGWSLEEALTTPLTSEGPDRKT